METSSPLAAMRPAPPIFGQRDIYLLQPRMGMDANSMGLREQMQRSRPDYFNVKSVRGSSPAASLAADLSQNFRLDNDASPRFPTPRRALFSTANNVMSVVGGRDFVTTPPLPPSSSPIPLSDMMDISPLPHKTPFVTQIEITSPTPIPSPADEMMVESPLPRQASLEPPKPAVAERRIAGLRRPSLSRAKGYSTGGMFNRLNAESQLPPFRFGGDRQPSFSSGLSLSECFEGSPTNERRPQTANSPSAAAAGGVRPKPHFASLSTASGNRNGSPMNTHFRRPSNPFARPRKQVRRSLSMFENPGDVMKASKKDEVSPTTTLQVVMDIEEEVHEPALPHFFPEGQNDSIPRIAKATFLEVLDGKYNDHFDQKMIIDCRFEYEYDGGHIDGAINYNDKELLATHLFRSPMDGRTLIVFHCEYSAHRAPIMARHIRAEDRTANAECYPRLTYPEVYILDGGYSGFFAEHRDRCYPQAYVEMDAAEHVHTCERKMGRLRQTRKGLSRAQTFAFGQADRAVDDSPTAPAGGRTSIDDLSSSPFAMVGNSPILGGDRHHARRMASY